jgi:hypothetical protein
MRDPWKPQLDPPRHDVPWSPRCERNKNGNLPIEVPASLSGGKSGLSPHRPLLEQGLRLLSHLCVLGRVRQFLVSPRTTTFDHSTSLRPSSASRHTSGFRRIHSTFCPVAATRRGGQVRTRSKSAQCKADSRGTGESPETESREEIAAFLSTHLA